MNNMQTQNLIRYQVRLCVMKKNGVGEEDSGLGLFCCSFVFIFLLDGVVRKGLSEEVMIQQRDR